MPRSFRAGFERVRAFRVTSYAVPDIVLLTTAGPGTSRNQRKDSENTAAWWWSRQTWENETCCLRQNAKATGSFGVFAGAKGSAQGMRHELQTPLSRGYTLSRQVSHGVRRHRLPSFSTFKASEFRHLTIEKPCDEEEEKEQVLEAYKCCYCPPDLLWFALVPTHPN